MVRMPKKREADVSTIVSEIANGYGFKNVTVEFVPHQEVKITWVRCGEVLDFQLADYLSDAPTNVIAGIVSTALDKITYRDPESTYGQDVRDWLTSEDFIRQNQPRYIERMRSVEPDDGRLQESYRRLIDKGYIHEDPDARLFWSSEMDPSMSRGSSLMHTVKVNDRLKDRSEFDDYCLDYAVMRGLCPSQIGFNPDLTEEDRHEFMQRIPYADSIEERMNDRGLFNRKPRWKR